MTVLQKYFKISLCMGCLLLGSLGLAAQKIDLVQLKTGDFLFQNLDCGPMCDAIEAVTKGWKKKSFSHIGLVERNDSMVHVWESMGAGVRRVSIASFRARSKHPLIVGRLKKRYTDLIPGALNFIKENEGVGYDEMFLYDNGKYYCSELIYDAFQKANASRPFFRLFPMTFKKPRSAVYFPVWEEYFKKMGQPIPEGAPGCNPGGLSRSGKIRVIGGL